MDGNNGVLMIPSPLKKRDFVHHQGREYQILKFLRATNRTEPAEGIIYRVRDTLNNHVVNITLPFVIHPHPEEEEVEDNFFQIVELNEDKKEVTLKSLRTRGAQRTMKVRWDEDLEFIRDGLMKENEDLFCTLQKVMGKEVIGDFKFMPKDPHLMKMPDEMMVMIFSKLTPEDRLTCRLVNSRWATILHVTKFVKCHKLFIHPDPVESNPITGEFHRLDIPNHPIIEKDVRDYRVTEKPDDLLVYANTQIEMKDLQPLINASLLEDVEYLSFRMNAKSKSRMVQLQHIQTTVSQLCRKLKGFVLYDKTEETEAAGSNWFWAQEIIACNKQHLKSLGVHTSFKEVDLFSNGQIGPFTSLKGLHLQLGLSQTDAILKYLESFPTSIIVLSIKGATFTKSQILWISSNFSHLEYGDFSVHHNHRGYSNYVDEDEVDGDTIIQVLNPLSSLRRLCLNLGPSIESGRDCCRMADHLRDLRVTRYSCSLFVPLDNNPAGGFERLEFRR